MVMFKNINKETIELVGGAIAMVMMAFMCHFILCVFG
jgi:hypothetical protein